MEVETMDPFRGYTNQKGKKTDIAQRANPPLQQTWRTTRSMNFTLTSPPTHLRDQSQPPTNDQTHTPEPPNSPNQIDKYSTIRNILQAGVVALETIENPKPEDTPKDVIALINLLSHKLTITKHNQDVKTIENHLELLNCKINNLTKTITPPNHNQNVATPQHRKNLPHTTHNTTRKQTIPQNPLARHHPSRLTIIFNSPPPINKRNEGARILTNVNNSLALDKIDVRIAGITWSLAGNCILLTRKGHSATDLKPHARSISHFLTKNPIQ
jgi:hypothetical protein